MTAELATDAAGIIGFDPESPDLALEGGFVPEILLPPPVILRAPDEPGLALDEAAWGELTRFVEEEHDAEVPAYADVVELAEDTQWGILGVLLPGWCVHLCLWNLADSAADPQRLLHDLLDGDFAPAEVNPLTDGAFAGNAVHLSTDGSVHFHDAAVIPGPEAALLVFSSTEYSLLSNQLPHVFATLTQETDA